MVKRLVSAIALGASAACSASLPAASLVVTAPTTAVLRAPAAAPVYAATFTPAAAPVLAVTSAPAAAPVLNSASAAPPAAKTSVTPEPAGYWTGPINSAVPATITGGKVIHDAHVLRTLLKRPETVVVDVSNAPRRPDNLATGAPWLPLPHHAIPGSLWIPGVGLGEIPPAVDEFFRRQLASATSGNLSRRVVIYCHQACWLSWNAAKRAISYGYRNVYWFSEGVEGWKAAHFPTAVIEPQAPPEG
jgi:PQQ-dependent catabolism-associated CXXCW motif protein